MPVARVLRLDPLPPPYLGLFLRALTMSILQSAGVALIAHRSPYALISAFLISYHWLGATRLGVDNRQRGTRLAYACGGSIGTGLTLLVAWWLG